MILLPPTDAAPPNERPQVIDLDRERKNRALTADNERLKRELEMYRTPGALDTARLSPHDVTSYGGGECRSHMNVLVDFEARRVICRTCKTDIDPILVLHQYATEERRFLSNNKAHLDEKRKLMAEIEALKKQRQNLRAAVRKAGGHPISDYELIHHEHRGTEPDLSAEASIATRKRADAYEASSAERRAQYLSQVADKSKAAASRKRKRITPTTTADES